MKDDEGRHFNVLGDPMRRAIFERVTRTPSSVGELAEAFPISRPAVSQHLKILKDVGLLVVRRHGTRNVYAADPSQVAALRATVERFWRDALAAFKDAAQGERTE